MAHLTTERKAVIFEKHLPLTIHMANKFHRRYKVPLQELIDEAQRILGLCVAQWEDHNDPARAYDPEKQCNATSWVYRRLNWDLLTYCTRSKEGVKQGTGVYVKKKVNGVTHKKEIKQFSPTQAFSFYENDDTVFDATAKSSWIDGLLHDLGEDARVLVDTILHAPKQLAEDISPRNPLTGRVRTFEYLKRQGWDVSRFQKAWREVEFAL